MVQTHFILSPKCRNLRCTRLSAFSRCFLVTGPLNCMFSYPSLVTPSLGFSCLVLYVQLPLGSALSHPSSSCEGYSSGRCPEMTGDSACLCCSSFRQVHWDPEGPVLMTELCETWQELAFLFLQRHCINVHSTGSLLPHTQRTLMHANDDCKSAACVHNLTIKTCHFSLISDL